MKIAYLILAHGNWSHLLRLVDSLDSADSFFFIHVDKKATAVAPIPQRDNVILLKDRVIVSYAGYSMVEATLRLLRAAYEANYFDYFALLSGADYPIRSNPYIHSFFENKSPKNFIDVVKIPDESMPQYRRLAKYHIEGGYRQKSLLRRLGINGTEELLRLLPFKRTFPKEYSEYEMCAGSSWWALHNSFVAYLLSYRLSNPKFFNFYRHSLCPDEMIFQTIMMNSPFRDSVAHGLTYDDWNVGPPPYPSSIGAIHLPILQQELVAPFYRRIIDHTPPGHRANAYEVDLRRAFGSVTAELGSECLFARKFGDSSSGILEKVETIRRSFGPYSPNHTRS